MAINKKRVLILTADAGMGHRSAAEAIKKALEIRYLDQCEVMINNPLNHPKVPSLFHDSQSDYDEIVKNLPELYKLGYRMSDATLPVTLMEGGFTMLLVSVLRTILKELSPDLIILTYPIYQAPLKVIQQSSKNKVPIMTVVTDLVTVHQVWFNTGVTCCTIPSKSAYQRALKAGLSTDQVTQTGIPVDPEILMLKQKDKSELREELGWESKPTTLLVLGSPRLSSLTDIIQTLNYSGHDIQFALVTGGSDTLYNEFKAIDWQHPVTIYDFVDFVPKLMRAADIILCKAGGLVVSESLASGLPLILVHAIPGQEKGNVDFVVENEAGQLCQTPLEVLKTLALWLKNDHEVLRTVAEKAEQLGRADAAHKIAEVACGILALQ